MNASKIYLQTPLILACKGNNIAQVKSLLKHNVIVSAMDCCDQMATHHAAALGNKQIVMSLIAAGTDVDAISINSSTPLHFAIEGDSIEHEYTIDFLSCT